MNFITIASWITLSRIALTPLVVYFFMQGAWTLGLVCFIMAMLTDLCDGYVARRFHQQSRLGQILDPIADKILLSCVMYTLLLTIAVSWSEQFCICFLIAKEAVLLVGGGILWFKYHIFIKPTSLSRLVSVCEVALVVLLVGSNVVGLMLPRSVLHVALMINVFVSALLLLRYGIKVSTQNNF